jgi:hypothetical protein
MSFENERRSTKLYDQLKSRYRPRYVVAGSVSVLCIFLLYSYLGPTTLRPPSALPAGDDPSSPPTGNSQLWSSRADQVKVAFQHTYSGYERLAFPHDELLPLSNGRDDK